MQELKENSKEKVRGKKGENKLKQKKRREIETETEMIGGGEMMILEEESKFLYQC